MFSNIVYKRGQTVQLTLTAGESIAVATRGRAQVRRVLGYPNVPNTESNLGEVNGAETIFGPYASGATIVVENTSESPVFYAVGTAPQCIEFLGARLQPAPGTLNATGTLTAALISGGIVTSTTAAGVTATLDTGAITDAALDMQIGDSFDWSAINTGANAFTVTAAASGHTVVGAGAVAAGTSGLFRTRKTAADTFVTYRIG